ncbi:hypothetical protein GCM10023231_11740 [Olivibacter ginsenosidimutans]|uniref:Mannose-6-phosphate isomerase type II C-terminal domain-containing protein n=1 Tax=Olivibacter ginsenosidimutans TaxID=1176537 RepID=A0ABP9AT13_9SPHI
MRISSKKDLFEEIRTKLIKQGFSIVAQDDKQPWGGSILIDEAQAAAFAEAYFTSVDPHTFSTKLPIRPKILVVEPGKAITWQYHERRAELWRVIIGEVGVKVNDSDEDPDVQVKNCGDYLFLEPKKRHRLVGLKNWGIIAQIWQHIDEENPSDDEDVVRINGLNV